MRAYKGFNGNLTCTMGQGTFQYKVGETFTAEKAKCASTGLHCVEEPIEVLTWYSGRDARYCIVEAGGDINESDQKISCTEMTLLKEISIEQLGVLECMWIKDHPDRVTSRHVEQDRAHVRESERIGIVRGKNPVASGDLGTTIFLLREAKKTKQIEAIGAFRIDGEEYKPGKYYDVTGKERRICAKRN